MKQYLKWASLLTKKEQKLITGGDEMLEPADGGGSCCWHANFESGDSIWRCGLTRSAAIAGANNWAANSGERSWWCCASCAGHGDQN